MLSSCVISIGREIISGIINDTNSFYLSSNLTSIGIYNRYIVSVDDIEQDISEAFLYYLEKVDIVITTGGLGPTFDDITIPSVARALKRELVMSDNAYSHIKNFYTELFSKGKIDSNKMNEKRIKMAYIPKGAIELDNKVGAAFGIYIKENGKHIFCLPGIPKEMKPMFECEVLPKLKRMSDGVTLSVTYDFDINDETVLTQVVDGIKTEDVYIKSLPTGFDSKKMGVRFTASGRSKQECMKKIEAVKSALEKGLYEIR